MLTKKWPCAMTASRLVPNDNASVPQRRGNPPPGERVRILRCAPGPGTSRRGVPTRIFLAPSRRKRLPTDFEEVTSKNKRIAARTIMEWAPEVSRAYGVSEMRGTGYGTIATVASKGKFVQKTVSSTNANGGDVFAVTIIYEGSVCFDGQLNRVDGQSEPHIRISVLRPLRWRKMYFSAFPIYESSQ